VVLAIKFTLSGVVTATIYSNFDALVVACEPHIASAFRVLRDRLDVSRVASMKT